MSSTNSVYAALRRLVDGYTPDRDPHTSPALGEEEPLPKRYTQPETQVARWLQSPIHGGYAVGLLSTSRTGAMRDTDALVTARWRLRVSYQLSPQGSTARDEDALIWRWADRWREHMTGNQSTSYDARNSLNRTGASLEWDSTDIDAFASGWAWMILSGPLHFYVST
jgi:hypothetical protein